MTDQNRQATLEKAAHHWLQAIVTASPRDDIEAARSHYLRVLNGEPADTGSLKDVATNANQKTNDVDALQRKLAKACELMGIDPGELEAKGDDNDD